jgi:DNA-binding GntR family transcriptional regulator
VPPAAAARKLARDIAPEAGVAERVADRIREDVRQGRLAPGQRLTEAELTQQLKASRGPVREALRRLEVDGILTFEKHRGVSVRRLTRDDFVHLLEVREVLEALAARLLAQSRRGGTAIAELGRIFKLMETAVKRGELERYNLTLYIQFHSLLVTSSDNPVLVRQWQHLNLDVLRQQFRPIIDLDLVRVAHREHAELVDALVARDAARAERAAQAHIAHFTEHIRRLPDRAFRQ